MHFLSLNYNSYKTNRFQVAVHPGGYCHIWAIQVCAAVKGMVFKQFTLA